MFVMCTKLLLTYIISVPISILFIMNSFVVMYGKGLNSRHTELTMSTWLDYYNSLRLCATRDRDSSNNSHARGLHRSTR